MITSIKNTWTDFWSFIKNPKDEADTDQSSKTKVSRLFSVLAIELLIMIVLTSIIGILEESGIIDMRSHKVEQMMQSFPVWAVLIFGALIIPFVEEVVFRFYLRFKNNYPLRILIFLSSIFGQKNKNNFSAFSERKWRTYYKSIFYFSAFLFAIVHLSNFDLSLEVLMFLPILIMPQFIVGLFAGYLRVKHSLVWSFLLHGIHNFILFSIGLFFMHQTTEKLNISNEQFDLKIEESKIDKRHTISRLGTDTASFTNIKLKPLLSQVLEVDEYNLTFNGLNKKSDKKYINLHFVRHDQNLDAAELILKKLQNLYTFSVQNNSYIRKSNELLIADSTLLFKSEGEYNEAYSSIMLKNSIKLENVSIDQLISVLNKEYDKKIVSKIKLAKKFNFDFQSDAFEDIEYQLKHEYGLYFEAVDFEFKEICIDFSKTED